MRCEPTTTAEPVRGPDDDALLSTLREIVGSDHVQGNVTLKAAKTGSGVALALVKPGTIQECLDALQACVDADVAVLPQGANTGLTGGSIPREGERPTVVLNLRRLANVTPIDDGSRMVCLGGAGIYDVLQSAAAVGRESHSVLGSIFLNPSVGAGIDTSA